jgi:hypothetical protein
VTLEATGGIFQHFAAAAPIRNVAVKVTQVRQAGTMPAPLLTAMNNTVVVPAPELSRKRQPGLWSCRRSRSPN